MLYSLIPHFNWRSAGEVERDWLEISFTVKNCNGGSNPSFSAGSNKKTGQKILAETVGITVGIGFNVQKDFSQTTWLSTIIL